jgi:hypothetical protein
MSPVRHCDLVLRQMKSIVSSTRHALNGIVIQVPSTITSESFYRVYRQNMHVFIYSDSAFNLIMYLSCLFFSFPKSVCTSVNEVSFDDVD